MLRQSGRTGKYHSRSRLGSLVDICGNAQRTGEGCCTLGALMDVGPCEDHKHNCRRDKQRKLTPFSDGLAVILFCHGRPTPRGVLDHRRRQRYCTLESDTALRDRCRTGVDLSEAAKDLWLGDKAGANCFFYLNWLAAIAYSLLRVEGAVEPTHIHHEPCSRCGGKLVFKDTVESSTTRSLICFFRCEDCGHVHTIERRSV